MVLETTGNANRFLRFPVQTYKKLKGDPTRKYKTELGNVLKELKDSKKITPVLHKKLYPTVDQPPRFYGLPKVHKKNTPLRPIVSFIGTITCMCEVLG